MKKTLYFECNMGAAGDMLMSALIELLPDPDDFTARLNSLAIPKVTIKKTTEKKCGITGTHMSVLIDGQEEKSQDITEHTHSHEHHHEEDHEHGHSHEHHHEEGHEHGHCHEHSHGEEHGHTHTHGHHHAGMKDIEHIVYHLDIPEQVKKDVMEVYQLIAHAESTVHGQLVEEIHFHEVGAMDAVADIVGVCLAMYELSPDRVVASPVHVGCGQIHCAHGILPVPAPATALLLKGIPVYGGRIQGELCTPTGAALLKHFVDSFGEMPQMSIEKIGYGMGSKDFSDANCLRAIFGTMDDSPKGTPNHVDCHEADAMDSIVELCCNLDDMTPEKIGFVTELLLNEGALDVYTTNIQMKKNRPAVMLTCMCAQEERDKFLTLILKHTTTLGVREYICRRYGLERTVKNVETPYGTVRIKSASGYGVQKDKPEYEDLARIAREQKTSIAEIEKSIHW